MRKHLESVLVAAFGIAMFSAYGALAGGVFGLLRALDVALISFTSSMIAAVVAIAYLIVASARLRQVPR